MHSSRTRVLLQYSLFPRLFAVVLHSCLWQLAFSRTAAFGSIRFCHCIAHSCPWQLSLFSLTSTHSRSWQHSPPAVSSCTGASAAFALLPPFYSLPTQLLVPAFAFAAFAPSLYTRLFSLSCHIWSLLAAFASCSFLMHRCFGSIRSSLPFWQSESSCTQLLVSAFAFTAFPPALHTSLFRSILANGCFWQHLVFLRMGALAAFALLSPFLAVFLHTVSCVSLRFPQSFLLKGCAEV